MSAVHLKRVPVCIRPEYTLLLERVIINSEAAARTFIHCTVHRGWSKGVKRKLTEDFHTICALVSPEPIYALHRIGDRKHMKFVEMFGFRIVQLLGDGMAIYEKDT